MRCASRRPAAVVVLALALAACGHEPAAELRVSSARFDLPYGTYVPLLVTLTPRHELPAGGGELGLFVHLVGSEGVVRTFDQPLAGDWQVGRALVQEVRIFQSLVGPGLPAGEYQLTAGVTRGGRERLELATAGKKHGRGEYVIATVTVPASGAAVPTATFDNGFYAVEPGRDRQIVARRWTSGDAVLTLHDLPGPGTVWLSVHVPGATAGESHLVLADGSDQPALRVDTTCSDTGATLSGSGVHSLDLKVIEARPDCIVHLVPDFHLLEDSGSQRKVGPAVAVLAWHAAS